MSNNYRLTTILMLLLLIFPQAILAVDEGRPSGHETDEKIHLSADLRALLGQEMMAIENGMKNLVPAISSGEWENVSSIALKIRDSFIMKQKLTETQKEELHRVLPHQFIEMDQDFHNSAGMLAHAAEMKNADVVNFYFYKLNTACVACHTKYAGERFPGLVMSKDAESNEGDKHEH